MQSARDRYAAARAADERLLRFKAELNAGRVAQAMAEAKLLVDGPYSEDSGALRVIAAAIAAAAQAGTTCADTALAVRAIARADELTVGNDGAVLATLARLRFVLGDVSQAIETQRRAIAVTPEAQRAMLQRALDEYVSASSGKRR